MRLAFVADGRSPIARSWIEYFVSMGHEVHLLTTRSCAGLPGLASLDIVALWRRSRSVAPGGSGALRSQRSLGAVTALRHWVGPLAAWRQARVLRGVLRQIQPDLVHALRIPFEGVLAAAAAPEAPLVVSTWGNDLTLHAPSTPIMRWATRRVLRRAAALHADCERDERLAREWGFRDHRPSLVAPGNGGVRKEVFHPGRESGDPDFGLRSDVQVVVQPRGLRAYVRSDTFFRSLPRILEAAPNSVFVCPAMEGLAEAESWQARLQLGPRLRLLPALDPGSMAALFRRAAVSVSPSIHDGTPNTLLEAMACGCLPVAGDLESIREWIREGENGLLIDPADPGALAEAVERGLKDESLRQGAARRNVELIAARADYDQVMPRAEVFYAEALRIGTRPDDL